MCFFSGEQSRSYFVVLSRSKFGRFNIQLVTLFIFSVLIYFKGLYTKAFQISFDRSPKS